DPEGVQMLSTSGMLRHVAEHPEGEFIVATETGMLYPLQQAAPHARLIEANRMAFCRYMKMITLPKLRDSLRDTTFEVRVPAATGSEEASWLAAGLLGLFAAALVGAILRGRAGAPCACFGSRSTVGWASVLRNLGLAACFAALPLLPQRSLSTDEWLAAGIV